MFLKYRKLASTSIALLILVSSILLLSINESQGSENESRNLFDFMVVDIDDNIVSLKRYEGKVVLIVNVASECGYTDNHYKALVKLQQNLASTNKFTVMGFPCNQFGKQEPGMNSEIKKFAEEKYNVNFPLFSKVNVIEKNVPDVWKFLTDEAKAVPNWNFWKYLVDQKGHVVHAWGPWVTVEDVVPHIMDVLNKGGNDGHGGEL